MTAKEYLKNAERLDLLIKAKEEELHILRIKSYRPNSSDISVEKVDQSLNVDILQNNISKIISCEDYIKQSIYKMRLLYQEINIKIDELSSGDHKTVLILRYLNFKEWEQICIDMNYSYSHTLLIHRKALEEFEKVHKEFLSNNSRK